MFCHSPKLLVTTSPGMSCPQCTVWPNDLLTVYKYVGNSKTKGYDLEFYNELFDVKKTGGAVIMFTLIPIAGGSTVNLFDYCLTLKQGISKVLLLRHHTGPPSLPDTHL